MLHLLPLREIDWFLWNSFQIEWIHFDPYLYIIKSWSVAFNAAALTLRHISYHVILFFFFFKYNFSYNFPIIFTIFSPINAAHYLFIYFHYQAQPKVFSVQF